MVSALADATPTSAFPVPESAPRTAVKLLDLVTNRYHAGVVRGRSRTGVCVEVSAAARLRAGQRVRCILAPASSGVLARGQMRRASVLQVDCPPQSPSLLLELAFMDDPTAS